MEGCFLRGGTITPWKGFVGYETHFVDAPGGCRIGRADRLLFAPGPVHDRMPQRQLRQCAGNLCELRHGLRHGLRFVRLDGSGRLQRMRQARLWTVPEPMPRILHTRPADRCDHLSLLHGPRPTRHSCPKPAKHRPLGRLTGSPPIGASTHHGHGLPHHHSLVRFTHPTGHRSVQRSGP